MGFGSRTPVPGFLLDDIIRTTRDHPARSLFTNAVDPERDWTDERLSEVMTPVDVVWGGFEPGGVELARKMVSLLPAARLTDLVSVCRDGGCRGGFGPQIEKLLRQQPPSSRKLP